MVNLLSLCSLDQPDFPGVRGSVQADPVQRHSGDSHVLRDICFPDGLQLPTVRGDAPGQLAAVAEGNAAKVAEVGYFQLTFKKRCFSSLASVK